MSDAKKAAQEVLESVREYPSGYRSHREAGDYSRPLSKLEDQLVTVLKALLEENGEDWEFRCAEIVDGTLTTYGPKGNPDWSFASEEEARAAAKLDDAFVVKRRKAGAWERVH